jgi:hypothetical protein
VTAGARDNKTRCVIRRLNENKPIDVPPHGHSLLYPGTVTASMTTTAGAFPTLIVRLTLFACGGRDATVR